MAHLQIALNGDSTHPAMPRTADEIARDAAECVAAGATLLHLHTFDDDGRESLEPAHVGRMLTAVRASCPGIPLNVTTFAEIEPDPQRRLELVSGWTELPDLISANQGEDGIDDLSALLVSRGVAIEACVLSVADAERFVAIGGWDRFERLVIEAMDPDPETALGLIADMEAVVARAGVGLEQLEHGLGAGTWAVVERAARLGKGIRVGLEDVGTLPDGSVAASNAELTVAAKRLVPAE